MLVRRRCLGVDAKGGVGGRCGGLGRRERVRGEEGEENLGGFFRGVGRGGADDCFYANTTRAAARSVVKSKIGIILQHCY